MHLVSCPLNADGIIVSQTSLTPRSWRVDRPRTVYVSDKMERLYLRYGPDWGV